MILKFPDLATLQLALTSATVPPAVSQAGAVAGFDEGDAVWVETAQALPRSATNELKKLGVQVCRSLGSVPTTEVSSWLELLPLKSQPDVITGLETTPVLFDTPCGELMARLAAEMLRLGNDRQGFRWLDGGSNGDGRALLRVVGPPYYSLLRALDGRGKPDAPIAYTERAPGVWVEVGFDHPLASQIKPPDGKLLLLRPPRNWALLADAPFREVYQVLELHVPDRPTRYTEGELKKRLAVTLSLRPGGSSDSPELWVLKGDVVAELNRFVQEHDDQLLTRLAFAVGEHDGTTTIVVRVRQSKAPPPPLVLNAVGYRHHLKLPNLFLPVGMGLQPPLRRDKVRELFAEDINQVTWLAPGEGGTFTPRSLPEDSFRPLTDWVDYVLDRDREALTAWVQAAQFDFEAFVCNEDGTPKQKKTEVPERPVKVKSPKRGKRSEAGDEGERFDAPTPSVEEVPEPLDDFGAVQDVEPSELEKKRRALEQQFIELEGGLDDPERRALWPELARVDTGLGHEDAGICWANALWVEKTTSAAWASQWFLAEARAAVPRFDSGNGPAKWWLARVTKPGARPEVTGDDLDLLLSTREPAVADLRALAAYLTWCAALPQPPAALVQRLEAVAQFLEMHERLLPVRAMWLAWAHLAKLASGDVLALARARDRLLERLFHNGLRPEQDLPGFLRSAGQPGSQRFHAVRDWMLNLGELARKWVKDNADPHHKPLTEHYLDLIFAFGLARQGEADAARQLLARAREALSDKDDAHRFLLEGYAYRINQALEGKPHTGPLPAEVLDLTKGMLSNLPYIVARVRNHSWVLEPDQRIDPYAPALASSTPLGREIVELTDMTDRKQIVSRVQSLLKGLPKDDGAEDRSRVLKGALEVAPRVGEEFARDLLDRVIATYDALPAPEDVPKLQEQAKFLERALFVAAHFDRIEVIHPLVARFQRLLQTQYGPKAVSALDSLAGQCFRGLRKLGMRNEIDRLLAQMADLVLQGRELTAVPPDALPTLLRLAAEWYFFGRDSQAEPVLQHARGLLVRGDLLPKESTLPLVLGVAWRPHKNLACAYARTVGKAPVAIAQNRLEEIFKSMKGFYDSFLTCTHLSIWQLDLVEAVVLAVVSDDFTMGTQARRWLDEDEFLVRRRVHADVRAIKGQG